MSMDDLRDKILEKQEKDVVTRALKGGVSKQVKKNKEYAFRFFDIPTLRHTVAFNYPTVSYLSIVNTNKLDAEGFPTIIYEQLQTPHIDITKEKQTIRGKVVGERIKDAVLKYDLATAVIKGDAVTLRLYSTLSIMHNLRYEEAF